MQKLKPQIFLNAQEQSYKLLQKNMATTKYMASVDGNPV